MVWSATKLQVKKQRIDVQTRTAHHDWHPAPSSNLVDSSPCLRLKFRCTKGLVRLNYIKQMMRHAGTFLSGWFGRTNVHAAVNCPRISANNLTVKPLGKRKRQGCFARCCLTYYYYKRWHYDDSSVLGGHHSNFATSTCIASDTTIPSARRCAACADLPPG